MITLTKEQMNIYTKIFDLRDQHKMSQEELSAASGISVRTIQRIEKGQVKPRPYTARKLIEAFNISLEEFSSSSVENSDLHLEESVKLNRFVISTLLVFPLPIIYLIILILIWKKGTWSIASNKICKKILSFNIIWTLFSVSLTFLTLFFIKLLGGQYVIGQLLPTPILVYLGLSCINLIVVIKIVKNASSKRTSMIPNLF
ncbi:MAG: hypothetical protein Sapg2KO_21120 [Saprospiraceae bacterium]